MKDILVIESTDLISESMHKINENFQILSEVEEQDRFKWENYVKSVQQTIDNLKSANDLKNIEMSKSLTEMNNKINGISTDSDIQKEVNNAIMNADAALATVIQSVAGQQVSAAMGEYAKTSTVNSKLEDYVTAVTFDIYKSNANEKIASANRIVANSTFFKDSDGYLVYSDTEESSQFKTIEAYFNSLSAAKKAIIDPDGKGLDDQTVIDNLVAECETVFKTVRTELTTLNQRVESGSATIEMVAAVSDPDNPDGEDFVASIFARANAEGGSEIKLNANNINITGDNQLNLSAGTFTITASNLTVDASGNVAMSGTITATSGSIGGITIASNEIKSSNNLFSVTNSGSLTAKSGTIGGITIASDSIKSSNNKFSVTNAGKLTATDATITGTVTATSGSIGGITIASNEIKSSNDKFSVTSSGLLTATSATIRGSITADTLVVNDNSFLNDLNVQHLTFVHEDEQFHTGDTESVIIQPTNYVMGDFAQDAPVKIAAYNNTKPALEILMGVVHGYKEATRVTIISGTDYSTATIIDFEGGADRAEWRASYQELCDDGYAGGGSSGWPVNTNYIVLSMHTSTPGLYYQNFVLGGSSISNTRTVIALPPLDYMHDHIISKIYNSTSNTIQIVGGALVDSLEEFNYTTSGRNIPMSKENIIPINMGNNNQYKELTAGYRPINISAGKTAYLMVHHDTDTSWWWIWEM